MLFHTGLGVLAHKYEKQGKDIRSGVGQYILIPQTCCADLN